MTGPAVATRGVGEHAVARSAPVARLYLVRHGETEWNRRGLLQGTANVPLNALGRRQSAALAGSLAGVAFDAAYTSPLVRARETAAAVLPGRGVRPVVLPDLQELCYGRWQGLDAAARERDDRALGERWRERSWSVRFPGGESLDDVDRRAARVLAGHPGGTVLLCAHGHFNRVLLLRALGWQRDRFWSVEQPNGCCYVLDVLGRASLASILTLDGRDE